MRNTSRRLGGGFVASLAVALMLALPLSAQDTLIDIPQDGTQESAEESLQDVPAQATPSSELSDQGTTDEVQTDRDQLIEPEPGTQDTEQTTREGQDGPGGEVGVSNDATSTTAGGAEVGPQAGQVGSEDAPSEIDSLPIIGKPTPNAIGFQPAATGLAQDVHWLDGMLLWIISGITLFVTALIAWCVIRYNRRSNPEPKTFTHHTPVEIAWTVVPIVILIFIGAFSVPMLNHQQTIPEGDVTIQVTGYQWYWGYEYPEHQFEFASYMLQRDELEEYGYTQDEYRLATDTAVVVPTGQDIVMQVTAGDVIHSWTIPAFGVKQDGVPGRLAELWFNVDEGMEGVYFGQCSELCGQSHAYMPITVKAVSPEEYERWLDEAIAEYGGVPRDQDVAQAQ